MEQSEQRPWLIAAWPGMGSVATIAASYLVQVLTMERAGHLEGGDHFDVVEVIVKGGIVGPPQHPPGEFFRWTNPKHGRDLVVFIGHGQPTSGTYAYAHKLLRACDEMRIERVITFASMASELHPSQNPRVFGIATDTVMLEELKRAEVKPLPDGQIGGLNGVLLGAAGERGLRGVCLLAEIPFFAANVPNPKAARAALSVFSVLAGIDVPLAELNKHAAAVDKALIEAYAKLAQMEPDEEDEEPAEEPPVAAESAQARPEAPKLTAAVRRRIEQLFAEAQRDRSRAVTLKKELDRRGVFKDYEDRFLDLFRRAD